MARRSGFSLSRGEEGAMQRKTITVVIDESGNSTVDLDGFEGQGCEKALKDFQGDDDARLRRKKAAYFARSSEQQEQGRKSGR
jgi:hypothetical protein